MRALTTGIGALILILASYSTSAASGGKIAYEAKCKTCHAVDGIGNPKIAKMAKVDPTLLDITANKNQKRTDAELIKVVREGQGKMKAIPKDKLSDDDLKMVIAYVRTLQKK